MSVYPGAFDSYTPKVDHIDLVMAQDVNELQDGIKSIEPVLGINPQGTAPDVKTRLDRSISSDGYQIVAQTLFLNDGYASGHGITSTLTGDLQISGNLTVDGSLFIPSISAEGTTNNWWTVDIDDSSATFQTFRFGVDGRYLRWNKTTSQFEFSPNNLYLPGILTIEINSGINALNVSSTSTSNNSSAITVSKSGSVLGSVTCINASATGASAETTTISAHTTAGTGQGRAVYALVDGTPDTNTAILGVAHGATVQAIGVQGIAENSGTYKFGGYFTATDSGTINRGIFASASGGTVNWAGYFDSGDFYVKGNALLAANDSISTSVARLRVQEDNSNYNYLGSIASLFENSINTNHGAGILGACQSTDSTGSWIASGIIGQGIIGSDSAIVRGVDGRIENSGSYINSITYSIYGLNNVSNSGGTNYGIYGSAIGADYNWAGFFDDGNVYIKNSLSVGTTTVLSTSQVRSLIGTSFTTSSIPAAIHGEAQSTTDFVIGVLGEAKTNSDKACYGIKASAITGSGASGDAYGLFAEGIGSSSAIAYGVYATASGGTNNYAGYFNGKTYITNSDSSRSLDVYSNSTISETIANCYFGDSIIGTYSDVIQTTAAANNVGIVGVGRGSPFGNVGIIGSALTASPSGLAIGVYGQGTINDSGNTVTGVWGNIYPIGSNKASNAYGGQFTAAFATDNCYGIYCSASGADSNYSGYFRCQDSAINGINYGVYSLTIGDSAKDIASAGIWSVVDGNSPNSCAVFGNSFATGQYTFAGSFQNDGGAIDSAIGIYAHSLGSALTKYGVRGFAGGSGENNYGGWFSASGPATIANTGLYVEAYTDSVTTPAVYGIDCLVTGSDSGGTGIRSVTNTTSNISIAGQFISQGTGGSENYGIYAEAHSATTNYGIYASASGGTTNWAGYFTGAPSYFWAGIFSDLPVPIFTGDRRVEIIDALASYGLYVEHSFSGGTAIFGKQIDGGIAVHGLSTSAGAPCSMGGFFVAGGSTTNYGIYATASGGVTNWAGYFEGDVNVTGTLSAGGISGPTAGTTNDTFTIDTDNTSTTPALIFGASYDKRITWDNPNNYFSFSDRLATQSDGSASSPVYTFVSDPDTGIYRIGPNILGFATDGAERMRISFDGTVVIPTANINGGTIDGTSIGATTPATGSFTTLSTSNDANINRLTVGRGSGYNEGSVAVGEYALSRNTYGYGNTAVGAGALNLNSSGSYNTAVGANTLINCSTGWSNVAVGFHALAYLTTGSNNIGIGRYAEVPNNEGSNQVRIGDTNISYAGIQVAWTITSDRKYKKKIRENKLGLNFVKQLKSVDYIRKGSKTREIGFVAQDVEKVLRKLKIKGYGLLFKNEASDCLELRYNDFISILVKAVQEQQEQIEEQRRQIESLWLKINKLEGRK